MLATPFARSKVGDWAHHPHELARRSAYVLLRVLARRDRAMTDADFVPHVDEIPALLPHERAGVRVAMQAALDAMAARNAWLGARAERATARLRGPSAAPALELVERAGATPAEPAVMRWPAPLIHLVAATPWPRHLADDLPRKGMRRAG